jgi:hypothetical protein
MQKRKGHLQVLRIEIPSKICVRVDIAFHGARSEKCPRSAFKVTLLKPHFFVWRGLLQLLGWATFKHFMATLQSTSWFRFPPQWCSLFESKNISSRNSKSAQGFVVNEMKNVGSISFVGKRVFMARGVLHTRIFLGMGKESTKLRGRWLEGMVVVRLVFLWCAWKRLVDWVNKRCDGVYDSREGGESRCFR